MRPRRRIFLQRYPQEDSYDEGIVVHPSSTSEVPHTDRNGMADIRGDQAMRKKSGWMTKISPEVSDKNSPMDKKQKRNADQ